MKDHHTDENEDFRAENYPRSYRVDARTRRILLGFGTLLVAFGIFMSALHIVGVMKAPLATGDLVADALFGAFALWMGFVVSRYVVLYEDRVELITWFARRALARGEIRGYRMGSSGSRSRYSSCYILVPMDRQATELRFPPLLHYDKYFRAWMREIPQIDRK